MNWINYKIWLLENVLIRDDEHERYILNPSALTKYSLINASDLEQALNDFLNSVDRKVGDLTYYSLPEWEENKTWPELFGKEKNFGLREKQTLPSNQTWNNLTELYQYWGTEQNREERLEKETKKIESETQQEIQEAIMSLVAKMDNKGRFINRYQEWLIDYFLIGKEAQKKLEEQKKKIEKNLSNLSTGIKRQEEWTQKLKQEIKKNLIMKIIFLSLLTSLISIAAYHFLSQFFVR